MNALVALLVLIAAGLASLVAVELRPQSRPADPASPSTQVAATPVPLAALDTNVAPLLDTVLARPLFSQTRRPPNVAGAVASVPSAAIPLPRMTAILIDGVRRSAIFASPGGKPTIVAEGGRIGPFTVQTIEPQQVIVIGPEGKRTVRTSFDPTLQPPAAAAPYGMAVPQFPGIAVPAGPSAGYGIPQPAGAAR